MSGAERPSETPIETEGVASRARLARAIVPALFLLSGSSGLVFEVIWVRQLTRLLGHTTAAVSLVVSAFLLGLVLGSLWFGPVADRVRRPLRAYASLEALTAALALAWTGLLQVLPDTALGSGHGPAADVLRVAVPLLGLLPPTIAMGGTLPVLARFLARSDRGAGRSFAVLYSLNTLGAALGCAIAGFWAIGSFGLLRTAIGAAALNAIVALGALVLERARGWSADSSAPSTASDPGPAASEAGIPAVEIATGPSGEASARRHRLLAIFALCGFTSIGYEVLWFRLLSAFLDSSSYAFTVLLVTFLLGLVAGGFVYALRLSRLARRLELLAALQVLIALAGLATVALLGHSRPIAEALAQGLGVESAQGRFLAMLLHASLVMLVPTSLVGVVFPLVVDLTNEHLGRLGRDVGLLYSANTLGGIVASLLLGFVAIPAAGTQACFIGLAVLGAGLGLAVLRLDDAASPRARRVGAIASLLVIPLGLLPPSDLLRRSFAERPDARVLWVREGRDGTLGVLEYDRDTICPSGLHACTEACPPPFSHRQLIFGSVSYATTRMTGLRYMSVLAHLPMLSHPAPRHVLEVCFGTGTTASTFARYDEAETIDLVDLNPDVFAAAPYFEASNRGVLRDPRVRPHVDDGRHFLQRSADRYDVISFEPPPPRSAGVSSLYTREFYELLRARLAPGGLVTQWIPLQEQSDGLDRGLVRAMLDVFPETALFVPARFEAVLIGSVEPLSFELDRWRERAARPELARALAEVGYPDAESLLGSFVAGPAALRRWAGAAGPDVTDDRPAVEHFLVHEDRPFAVASLLDVAESPAPWLRGAPVDPARLSRELEAGRTLLKAADARRRRDWSGALRLAEEAGRRGGENAYVRFLVDQEYGCEAAVLGAAP